jgi:hypothetical protein
MIPAVLACEWPATAHRIFDSFPANEREAASHILMVSIDLQDDDGSPNWPRSYVHTSDR